MGKLVNTMNRFWYPLYISSQYFRATMILLKILIPFSLIWSLIHLV